ncbi:MAG: ATP-binding protein [Prevotella sp.]|jgi:AAA+ ATPase superfamily predicted ATPase|nr:ATP-binding protein [Prevotella sp.]
MEQISNPFVIGKYVSKEYFCDREKEAEVLMHHILNGRNVTLMSERRLGKTGLIEHVFANYLPDGYEPFVIDIYTCKSLKEMVYMLANEVFGRIKRRQPLLDRMMSVVRSLKTTITYDVVTGMPELGLRLGEIIQPEVTLDEILCYLESADNTCIVAIDEFQKIADFEEGNIEALLRTKIQHLKKTQFVFAGSERHLIENIFSDPNRPFYNSVVFQQLLPIQKDVYTEFCEGLFARYGKTVSEELVSRLYDVFQGVTWYMQLAMNEAFTLVERGEHVAEDAYNVILTHLVDTKRFTFEDRFASLTDKQKMVLLAIANEYPNAVTPTSQEFITRYNLKTASSVQTAIKGLIDKNILTDYRGEKRPTDMLWMLWLKKF